MEKNSQWLLEKEASQVLRVNKETLEILREQGYLKPGSHWRSSSDPDQLPWKPKVFYRISCCREVVEHLENLDSPINQIAA